MIHYWWDGLNSCWRDYKESYDVIDEVDRKTRDKWLKKAASRFLWYAVHSSFLWYTAVIWTKVLWHEYKESSVMVSKTCVWQVTEGEGKRLDYTRCNVLLTGWTEVLWHDYREQCLCDSTVWRLLWGCERLDRRKFCLWAETKLDVIHPCCESD